jgi:hypothetical protein
MTILMVHFVCNKGAGFKRLQMASGMLPVDGAREALQPIYYACIVTPGHRQYQGL